MEKAQSSQALNWVFSKPLGLDPKKEKARTYSAQHSRVGPFGTLGFGN
jgi:hypothetical protein